jgi:hypothetical protein
MWGGCKRRLRPGAFDEPDFRLAEGVGRVGRLLDRVEMIHGMR